MYYWTKNTPLQNCRTVIMNMVNTFGIIKTPFNANSINANINFSKMAGKQKQILTLIVHN